MKRNERNNHKQVDVITGEIMRLYILIKSTKGKENICKYTLSRLHIKAQGDVHDVSLIFLTTSQYNAYLSQLQTSGIDPIQT